VLTNEVSALHAPTQDQARHTAADVRTRLRHTVRPKIPKKAKTPYLAPGLSNGTVFEILSIFGSTVAKGMLVQYFGR
jgi:hypothetical protein